MTTDLVQLREKHEAAKIAHETTLLQAETAAITGAVFPGMVDPMMPRQESLQEAWGDMVGWNEYPAGERDRVWGMSRGGLSVGADLGDRVRGQNRLVFEDEYELARVRAIGRLLCDTSVNAKCVQENLTSYILGTGYTYKVVPQDGEEPQDELVEAVQRVVNEFLRENAWTASREEELFKRSRRDGEYFLALYHVGDGRVQSRILEPEQIQEPADPRDIMRHYDLPDLPWSWTFGVATDDDDLEAVHGYTVRWQTPEGRDTMDWFAEDRIVHCKLNVDVNIKRGISDYFAPYEYLEDAKKLMRNTAKGHAIMSAIAFIRQHAKGVTESQVESMRANTAWARYTQTTKTEGDRSRYTHYYQPGTIVDVPSGQEYKASPMAEQGVGQAMITVEDAVLRIAGSNWCMPSYMIAGDTSGNYASTLVTESPFVKYCQRQQKKYKEYFGEVLWKALAIAHGAGRFDSLGIGLDDMKVLLRINVETPIVPSRNRNEETNRRKILSDSGVLSLETWAAEEGYDYEKEVKQGAERRQIPSPFAGGDQPGQPVEKETHPQDTEQPFRGKPQPDMAKYESLKEGHPEFDPSQVRDKEGEWSETGSSTSSDERRGKWRGRKLTKAEIEAKKTKREKLRKQESWTLTPEEFHQSQIGKPYKDFIGRPTTVRDTPSARLASRALHRNKVIDALGAGKAVPQKAVDAHSGLFSRVEKWSGELKRKRKPEAVQARKLYQKVLARRKEYGVAESVHSRLAAAASLLWQGYPAASVDITEGHPEFDPSQARGRAGKWTSGGGGSVVPQVGKGGPRPEFILGDDDEDDDEPPEPFEAASKTEKPRFDPGELAEARSKAQSKFN